MDDIQDFFIFLNLVTSFVAVMINLKRAGKENPRRNIRYAAAFMAGYIFFVYLLVVIGIVSEFNIPAYLRAFQSVVMLYMIVEARNG